VIKTLGDGLAELAKGNLQAELGDLPEAYKRIAEDFHNMSYNVSSMVRRMAEASENVQTGASEIDVAANDLAMRTERQAWPSPAQPK
jgi:methyl-accepting chemotaxis protein